MLVSENIDSLRQHLISFHGMYEYMKTKEKKDIAIGPSVDAYLNDQLAMEEGMKAWADYERSIFVHNNRLLKAIKSVKGKTFSKYINEIIKECDNVTDKMQIVKEPVGNFQKENYGRTIKGIWINQWSVGMEGDSWNGTVCVELRPNKYLKFSYSM